MSSTASKLRSPLPSWLLAEWHSHRNTGVDPGALSAGSGRRVWWRCALGHEWQAPIYRRTSGSGCPYCAGSRPTSTTSLAAVAPAIAAEWHPTRNGARTPDATMPGSDRRVWWRCAAGHEWQATPQARAKRGSGCPYCSGRRTARERSLLVLAPDLAAELHPTRNDGLDASTLSPGSSRRVWWLGACGHEWKAPVKTRMKVGTGCPRCADTALRGVPLATLRPDLVGEWHFEFNGGPPDNIAAGSHKHRWWQCAADPTHVWRAQVRNRVRARSGCPYCAGKRATPEGSLARLAPGVAAEWHPERNGEWSPTDVLPQSNKPAWWLCPAGHEWRARPANRIHGSGCPRCAQERRGAVKRVAADQVPVAAPDDICVESPPER